MDHVLKQTRMIYTNLDKSNGGGNSKKDENQATISLAELAKAVGDAGEEWKASARRTRHYLSKLARWAQAEINRQITLFSLKEKTNFDPVQLAFAVSIYHHSLHR